ncbi:MAG: MMPL family transporter, partial [Schumannella sp.]
MPRWLRIFLPAVLILVWFAAAGVGGPYFGKVSEVSSNDQTSYLPESADATRVQALTGEFNDSTGVPAIIVFISEGALTDDQLGQLGDALEDASHIEGVGSEASPVIPSDDRLAAQAFVPIDSEGDLDAAVAKLGDELRASVPDGITVLVTGP